MEILFNNKLITQLIKVTNVERGVYPERNINSISIPNRNGVYFQGAYFGERQIAVDFYFKQEYLPIENGDSRYNQFSRSLMYYLTTDAPAKLVFSDEPTKYYWAIVESVDISQMLGIGEGTILFKCLDCFAYATELKTYTMDDGTLKVYNYGTATAYPTFKIEFSKATRSFAIVTRNQVIQIGDPNAIEQPDWVYTNQRIHTDNILNLTKWYYGSQQLLATGDNSGRVFDESITFGIDSDGEVMRPTNLVAYEDNAGTGAYKGGFMLTQLNKTTDYWKAIMQFEMSSRQSFDSNNRPQQADQQGIVEMIGYDVNNVVLFRLSMRDYHKTMTHNEPFWYLGNDNLVWRAGTSTAKSTTKTYSQVVASDDDIPENANIITDIDRVTYTINVVQNGAKIYASASTKAKVLTTVNKGVQLIYKSETGSFYHVYTTDDLKNTGYISKSYCTKEVGSTVRVVTYEVTTYGTSSGKYNDWWGRFELTRKKNGNGSTWELVVKRINFTTKKHSVVFTKSIKDPNNSYTKGGALAKIGVFIGGYQDANPCGRMAFNYLAVDERIEEYEADNSGLYIAEKDDVIEINCDEQMVYKNGSEFMEMLDVGSDFIQLQPFSNTECQIITDDENVQVEVDVQERFI